MHSPPSGKMLSFQWKLVINSCLLKGDDILMMVISRGEPDLCIIQNNVLPVDLFIRGSLVAH